MSLKIFFVLAVAGLIISSCAGLPDDLKKKGQKIPEGIELADKNIDSRLAAYDTMKKSDDYKKILEKYAQREKWESWFANAKSKAKEAKDIFNSEIKPILDKDSAEKPAAEALKLQIERAELALKESDSLSKKPVERASFLKDVSLKSAEMLNKAVVSEGGISLAVTALNDFTEKAKTDFPEKAEDLAARYNTFKKVGADSKTALETAQKEAAAGEMDLAIFGDSYKKVEENLAFVAEKDKKYREKVAELERSYSKILSDMRVDYSLKIGRSTWDEDSDWENEHSYVYSERKIDDATADYLSKLPQDGELASLRRSFLGGGKSVRIDNAIWDSFRIDWEENWASGDDSAVYFIADMESKYFHKYIILENDVKKETDWTEVDEAVFDTNQKNLGMAIVSKPFGVFEEEAINQATPPGMSYIGNSRYGRWRDDGHGTSFWEWYGMYMFMDSMLGGRRYYRGDWDGWNRDYRGRRPYYGPQSDPDRWGSGSSYTRTHYSGSSYGSTGGFARPKPTIRGAGVSRRGGGPGGSGK